MHFRFAYRDGEDWFERTSNDDSLGIKAFMSLSSFGCVIPFGTKPFEGFVNISYFDPCFNLELFYPLESLAVMIVKETWSHSMSLMRL